jgi:hypothetical protein
VHCGDKLFSLIKCHFIKFALEMKKLPNFRDRKIGEKNYGHD